MVVSVWGESSLEDHASKYLQQQNRASLPLSVCIIALLYSGLSSHHCRLLFFSSLCRHNSYCLSERKLLGDVSPRSTSSMVARIQCTTYFPLKKSQISPPPVRPTWYPRFHRFANPSSRRYTLNQIPHHLKFAFLIVFSINPRAVPSSYPPASPTQNVYAHPTHRPQLQGAQMLHPKCCSADGAATPQPRARSRGRRPEAAQG